MVGLVAGPLVVGLWGTASGGVWRANPAVGRFLTRHSHLRGKAGAPPLPVRHVPPVLPQPLSLLGLA